jgi:dGTPase
MNQARSANVRSVEDVRRALRRLAAMTPETSEVNRQLKELLSKRVYQSAQLNEERTVAAAKIAYLFEYLCEHPERISAGFREQLEDAPIHRVICDYIAGMTDGFFLKTYEALAK